MFPTGGLFTHGSRRPHRGSGLEQCSLCNVYWALGIRPHFGDEAWTSPRRAPPLYPAGVTLSPDVTPESVLARVDTSAGCSIRDSFSAPSLGTHGFSALREGSGSSGGPTSRDRGGTRASGWRGETMPTPGSWPGGSRPGVWPGCLHAISERFPDLPIVGYESASALPDAVGQGFAPVGSFRVWRCGGEPPSAVHC